MRISMKLSHVLDIRTPLSLKTAIAAGIVADERENEQLPITTDNSRRAQVLAGKVTNQSGSERVMEKQFQNDAQHEENESSWGELGKFRPGDCEFKERELGKFRPGDSEFKGNAVSKGRLLRGRG
jgi:hypothetical protein